MKYRKLRIVSSVAWDILCLLLIVLSVVAGISTSSLASENTSSPSAWKALRKQIEKRQKSVKSFEVRFKENVVDATPLQRMFNDRHHLTIQMKGDRQIRVAEEGESSSKTYLARKIAVTDGEVHKSYYPILGNVYPAGFIDKKDKTHLYSHVTLLPIAVRYRMLEWLAAEYPGLSDDQISVRTGTVDGKSCVVASWNFRGLEREVYLDRTRDLIPIRVQATVTDPKMTQVRLQWDIQYSAEDSGYHLDGWKAVTFDAQGHVIRTSTAKPVEFKVNPDLADSLFQIEFPVGTYVEDRVANENYILKENFRKRHVSSKEWQSGATYESLLNSEPKVED